MAALARMRFLERYGYAAKRVSASNEEHEIEQSVIRHIANLLHCRRGTIPFDPEYGLDEINRFPGQVGSPEAAEICQGIANTIARYEPRAGEIVVDFDGWDERTLSLRFRLSLEIHLPKGKKQLQWHTTVAQARAGV
ncbi:MAG: type VI secretion system baseplate subunit TssE [Gammaproteobacteria bacterium]|nr:type VI secretion system baseplate subunit TssE [Gammaproteobacteria bacterium]